MRNLLILFLLLFACKTTRHGGGAGTSAQGGIQNLDPNACAALYDKTEDAPPVDPSTLTLSNATVTPVQMKAGSSLSIPHITVQANPDADVTYYQLCNPGLPASKGCYDGVLLTPVPNQVGYYGSYVYNLAPTAASYHVTVAACVRQDRVSAQGSGTQVIHPLQYPDLELFCGPSLSLSLPYNQAPFPDSVLAEKLEALDAQNVVVNQALYAMIHTAKTYGASAGASQSQLAGFAATFAQDRESLFPLLKSTILDNAIQVAQTAPGGGAGGSLGLAGSTVTPHCVTNGQLAQAIAGATGTVSTLDDGGTAPVSSSPGVSSTPGVVSNSTSSADTGINTQSLSALYTDLTTGNDVVQQVVAAVTGGDTGDTSGDTSGGTSGDTSGGTSGDTSGGTSGDTSGSTSVAADGTATNGTQGTTDPTNAITEGTGPVGGNNTSYGLPANSAVTVACTTNTEISLAWEPVVLPAGTTNSDALTYQVVASGNSVTTTLTGTAISTATDTTSGMLTAMIPAAEVGALATQFPQGVFFTVEAQAGAEKPLSYTPSQALTSFCANGSSSSSGVGAGVIAGAVVGSVAGVAALAAVAVLYVREQRQRWIRGVVPKPNPSYYRGPSLEGVPAKSVAESRSRSQSVVSFSDLRLESVVDEPSHVSGAQSHLQENVGTSNASRRSIYIQVEPFGLNAKGNPQAQLVAKETKYKLDKVTLGNKLNPIETVKLQGARLAVDEAARNPTSNNMNAAAEKLEAAGFADDAARFKAQAKHLLGGGFTVASNEPLYSTPKRVPAPTLQRKVFATIQAQSAGHSSTLRTQASAPVLHGEGSVSKVRLLASSPEETFLANFSAQSAVFQAARTKYLALQDDLLTYLKSSAP